MQKSKSTRIRTNPDPETEAPAVVPGPDIITQLQLSKIRNIYVAFYRNITRLGLALAHGNAIVEPGPLKINACGVEDDLAESEKAPSAESRPSEQMEVLGIEFNGVEIRWPDVPLRDDPEIHEVMRAVETVLEVYANNRGCVTPVEEMIHGLLLLYRNKQYSHEGVLPEEVQELVDEFRDCFEDMIIDARRVQRQYPELLKGAA
jgi:hypothetical protein